MLDNSEKIGLEKTEKERLTKIRDSYCNEIMHFMSLLG
jgi:hypothetical protein